MPFTNFVDALNTIRKTIDTITDIKSMVIATTDLNFSDMSTGLTGGMLSTVTDSVPGLTSAVAPIQNGLSTISNIPNMTTGQITTLSSISGVPTSVLTGLSTGTLTGTDASTESITTAIGSVHRAVGTTEAISSINTAIADMNSEAGQTVVPAQLTPTTVKSAMDKISGGASTVTLPGLGTIENSDGAAQGVSDTISTLMTTSGGNPSSMISQFTGSTPSITTDTLANPQILSALLPTASVEQLAAMPSQLQTAASDTLSGASSTFSDMADNISGISSQQLDSMTSGIYTSLNLDARLQRMDSFKTLITSTISTVPGLSISI
jgi:hypothetical protein